MSSPRVNTTCHVFLVLRAALCVCVCRVVVCSRLDAENLSQREGRHPRAWSGGVWHHVFQTFPRHPPYSKKIPTHTTKPTRLNSSSVFGHSERDFSQRQSIANTHLDSLTCGSWRRREAQRVGVDLQVEFFYSRKATPDQIIPPTSVALCFEYWPACGRAKLVWWLFIPRIGNARPPTCLEFKFTRVMDFISACLFLILYLSA